jgi:N-acetylglucosamine-6-phosphate deacetylase
MTRAALVGARILTAGAWKDGHAVILDADRIEAVLPVAQVPAALPRHSLDGGTLLPGFIDTQVNGGDGVLLNDAPTLDGVRAIAEAHRRFGTTGLLPTLISDDLDKVARAIAAVDAAIEAKVPGVLGIHLEGPFLNERKRGIHDAAKFRRLDRDAVALLASLKNGKTLVTLAPELCDAGLIGALVERGVIVAAGHTLATYEQMQAAFAEGLRGVTHLFNAMTQLESRAPGVVGAALESKTCISGIIADGHHVAPAT